MGIAASTPDKPLWYKAGDVLQLRAQPRMCKRVANELGLGELDRVCQPETATLVVESFLGKGGLSEVYAVTVTEHKLPTKAAVWAAAAEDAQIDASLAATASNSTAVTTAAAVDTAAAAAAAAAVEAFVPYKKSLVGKKMALKVSKRWSALSAGVQKLYGEESVYFETVETSSISQHWIMSSPDLGAGEGILQSFMAGTVIFEGGNSTEVRPCAVLMELAQGGSLQGLVEQMHWKIQKPKKRRTVAAQAELVHHLLKKVLTSLDRLHTEGWAHLDLKLGNVVSREKQDITSLLQSDYDADKLQPLLIDFGSAVYLGRAKHKPGVRSIYTVSYASPELQHWQLVSRKADVWSVGVLLLSLRTGSPPSMKHTKCPAPMHKADPDSLSCADTHAAVLRNLRKQAKFQEMSEREWDFVQQALTFDWHERPSAGELLNSDYMVYGP